MGGNIYDNKLVITEVRSFQFQFDLSKNVEKNLRHEVDHTIRYHGFLAEQRIKKDSPNIVHINMET